MYSSKLLNLIRTFNEKEQSQLLKFVRFNNKSNGYNIVLLEQILKESPYFTSEKLKKEEVFKQVYPKKTKYNDVVLRRCMSRLFYLCEDFVVHLKVQEDERVKQLYLMEYYEENKMEQHFGGVLRKWKHKEEGKVAVGDRFFL